MEAARADCSPDSQTGGPNSNYGVQKKRGNTRPGYGRSMERNSRRLQATNLELDTDSRRIKIRTKWGRKEICEQKIDRSAEKRCYVLPYSLVKCSKRSNLKTARKNWPRNKLRRAPQAPSFGYEQPCHIIEEERCKS